MPRKSQLKEVPIFPTSCETGHNFVPYSQDGAQASEYYKEDTQGRRITNAVYAMLYCTKCGETKEISIVTRRR